MSCVNALETHVRQAICQHFAGRACRNYDLRAIGVEVESGHRCQDVGVQRVNHAHGIAGRALYMAYGPVVCRCKCVGTLSVIMHKYNQSLIFGVIPYLTVNAGVLLLKQESVAIIPAQVEMLFEIQT